MEYKACLGSKEEGATRALQVFLDYLDCLGPEAQSASKEDPAQWEQSASRDLQGFREKRASEETLARRARQV